MDVRIALVTGASSGIGYATALGLAARGWHLVLLCRDDIRGRDAVSGIARHTDDMPELLVCDLADPTAIDAAASRYAREHGHLDALVNNAAGYFPDRGETATGLERTFAVNHLGPYRLTRRLLPALRSAPAGRVVTVSSMIHPRGEVVFDDLQRTRRRWHGMAAYADSKLMNVLFAVELARRAAGSAVTSNAVDPGVTSTRFGGGGWISRLFPLVRWALPSNERAAAPSIRGVIDPTLSGVTGRYLTASGAREPGPKAADPELARRLWQVSADLCGLPEDDADQGATR